MQVCIIKNPVWTICKSITAKNTLGIVPKSSTSAAVKYAQKHEKLIDVFI